MESPPTSTRFTMVQLMQLLGEVTNGTWICQAGLDKQFMSDLVSGTEIDPSVFNSKSFDWDDYFLNPNPKGVARNYDVQNNMCMPLTIEARICLSPNSTESINIKKEALVPMNTLDKLRNDFNFSTKFTNYMWIDNRNYFMNILKEKHTKNGIVPCGSCGKNNSTSFCAISIIPPPSGMHLRLVSLPCVPVCMNGSCNQKLRQHIQDFHRSMGVPRGMGMVMCANGACKKTEKNWSSREFLVCAGCKMRYYCSRKCQKADWKDHKILCKSVCISREDRIAVELEKIMDMKATEMKKELKSRGVAMKNRKKKKKSEFAQVLAEARTDCATKQAKATQKSDNDFDQLFGEPGTMSQVQQIMQKPKVREMMIKAKDDPRFIAAMNDPAGVAKYQNDPYMRDLFYQMFN